MAELYEYFLPSLSCFYGTPPCYFWPCVFFQMEREMCYVASTATQAEAGWLQYTAEFLTCHSNPPDSLADTQGLPRFQLCVASVPSSSVRTALSCKQMCSPVFRTSVKGTGKVWSLCAPCSLGFYHMIPWLCLYTLPFWLIGPWKITIAIRCDVKWIEQTQV